MAEPSVGVNRDPRSPAGCDIEQQKRLALETRTPSRVSQTASTVRRIPTEHGVVQLGTVRPGTTHATTYPCRRGVSRCNAEQWAHTIHLHVSWCNLTFHGFRNQSASEFRNVARVTADWDFEISPGLFPFLISIWYEYMSQTIYISSSVAPSTG